MAIGVGIGVVKPKTFRSSAMIKIGNPYNVPIEDYKTIRLGFKQDHILQELAIKVGFPLEKVYSLQSKFKIKEVGNLLILIEGFGSAPDQSLNVVNSIVDIILQRHEKSLELNLSLEKIVFFKKRISILEDGIKSLKLQINLEKASISEAKSIIFATLLNNLESKENTIFYIKGNLLDEEKRAEIFRTHVTIPAVKPMTPQDNWGVYFSISILFGLFFSFFWVLICEWSAQSRNKQFIASNPSPLK